MSNRRRAAVPDQIRQAVGCPDCHSRLVARGRWVEVQHDASCPALAALARQRRTVQLAVLPGPSTTDSDLETALVAITQRHRDIWPDSLGVRVASGTAYADLYPSSTREDDPR